METDEPQEQAQAEEPKAKAPDPRLPVRVVGQREGSALVEWIDEAGMYRRAYVPPGKIKDGTIAAKDLKKGIPYGLPWEDWIKIEATPERIANELRRMGMWTWQDINNAVISAANRAFDQGAFLRRVDQEVNRK